MSESRFALNVSSQPLKLYIYRPEHTRLRVSLSRSAENLVSEIDLSVPMQDIIEMKSQTSSSDKELCHYILTCLIPADILKLFLACIASPGEQRVCLSLPVNDSALWAIQWEYIIRGISGHKQDVQICRMPSEGRHTNKFPATDGPLSVLVTSGSGSVDYRSIQMELEIIADFFALHHQESRLRIIPDATFRDIESTVESMKPQIIHHLGRYNGLSLMLSDGTPFSANYLFYLCREQTDSVGLVILSGQKSQHIGLNLATQGLPTLCISNASATETHPDYWPTFYADLFDTGSVGHACAIASTVWATLEQPTHILPCSESDECELLLLTSNRISDISSQDPETASAIAVTEVEYDGIDFKYVPELKMWPEEANPITPMETETSTDRTGILVVSTYAPGALVEILDDSGEGFYVSGTTDSRGRILMTGLPETIVKVVVTFPYPEAPMVVKHIQLKGKSTVRKAFRYYSKSFRVKMAWLVIGIILLATAGIAIWTYLLTQ